VALSVEALRSTETKIYGNGAQTMNQEKSQKKLYARKSVRFNPAPGTAAQVCYGPTSKKFTPDHVALVLSEAYRGCSIVLALAPELAVGDKVRVKLGELAPLLAEVCWVILLDEKIQKVGFKYLE
jgi:hypothetical protein